MSYYDFNDHFWTPQEVCGQKSAIIERKKPDFSLKKLYYLIFKQDSYQDQLELDRTQANEQKDRLSS